MLATVELHFNRLGVTTDFENKKLEIFNNADQLLDESNKEVRRISQDLNDGSISSFGLKMNLQNLRNALELSNSIKLNILFENDHLITGKSLKKRSLKLYKN